MITIYAQYSNAVVGEVETIEEAREMAKTSAIWIEEEDLNAEMAAIEIVHGASCTDSECSQFEAEFHRCEVDHGNGRTGDHMASHTVTLEETAIIFACRQGVVEIVEQAL